MVKPATEICCLLLLFITAFMYIDNFTYCILTAIVDKLVINTEADANADANADTNTDTDTDTYIVIDTAICVVAIFIVIALVIYLAFAHFIAGQSFTIHMHI